MKNKKSEMLKKKQSFGRKKQWNKHHLQWDKDIKMKKKKSWCINITFALLFSCKSWKMWRQSETTSGMTEQEIRN